MICALRRWHLTQFSIKSESVAVMDHWLKRKHHCSNLWKLLHIAKLFPSLSVQHIFLVIYLHISRYILVLFRVQLPLLVRSHCNLDYEFAGLLILICASLALSVPSWNKKYLFFQLYICDPLSKTSTSRILWKYQKSVCRCLIVQQWKKWKWSVACFPNYRAKCIVDTEHNFSRKTECFYVTMVNVTIHYHVDTCSCKR